MTRKTECTSRNLLHGNLDLGENDIARLKNQTCAAGLR